MFASERSGAQRTLWTAVVASINTSYRHRRELEPIEIYSEKQRITTIIKIF